MGNTFARSSPTMSGSKELPTAPGRAFSGNNCAAIRSGRVQARNKQNTRVDRSADARTGRRLKPVDTELEGDMKTNGGRRPADTIRASGHGKDHQKMASPQPEGRKSDEALLPARRAGLLSWAVENSDPSKTKSHNRAPLIVWLTSPRVNAMLINHWSIPLGEKRREYLHVTGIKPIERAKIPHSSGRPF